jgi:hypothetical protein
VAQLDKEASQTRDSCVAKNETLRAARPDPFGWHLRVDSSPRKESLLRVTTKLHNPRSLLHHFCKDDNQRVKRQ